MSVPSMSAADRALQRLTIVVAPVQATCGLYVHHDRVGSRQPTKLTILQRLDRGSARRKLGGSASVVSVVLDSDKLAFNTSLAAPVLPTSAA
jgi:hypothetical protein